jgi:hypothetical protein
VPNATLSVSRLVLWRPNLFCVLCAGSSEISCAQDPYLSTRNQYSFSLWNLCNAGGSDTCQTDLRARLNKPPRFILMGQPGWPVLFQPRLHTWTLVDYVMDFPHCLPALQSRESPSIGSVPSSHFIPASSLTLPRSASQIVDNKAQNMLLDHRRTFCKDCDSVLCLLIHAYSW